MLLNEKGKGNTVFAIPMEWIVTETFNVRADSLIDAVKYLKEHINEIPLGSDPCYLEGSHRISADLTGNMPVGEVADNLEGFGYQTWDIAEYLGVQDERKTA